MKILRVMILRRAYDAGEPIETLTVVHHLPPSMAQQLELPAVGEVTDNLPAPPPQPGDGDPHGLPSRIGQER
jgi:hypothetical protein